MQTPTPTSCPSTCEWVAMEAAIKHVPAVLLLLLLLPIAALMRCPCTCEWWLKWAGASACEWLAAAAGTASDSSTDTPPLYL